MRCDADGAVRRWVSRHVATVFYNIFDVSPLMYLLYFYASFFLACLVDRLRNRHE
jgi:hypothetical protein